MDDHPRSEDNPKKVFSNNGLVIAYSIESFWENDLETVLLALKRVVRAQNVQALAREAGLRRDTTFGSKVDPQLSCILKVFKALNVKFEIVQLGSPICHLAPSLVDRKSLSCASRF